MSRCFRWNCTKKHINIKQFPSINQYKETFIEVRCVFGNKLVEVINESFKYKMNDYILLLSMHQNTPTQELVNYLNK